MQDLQDVFLLY